MGLTDALIAEIAEIAGGPVAARLSAAVASGSEVGWVDLAGLVGHHLRRAGGSLRVPRGEPWPTLQQWKLAGHVVEEERPESLLVRAGGDWQPGWLDGSKVVAPLGAAFANELRRAVPASGKCPADPAVTALTGFADYTSPGQRGVVRAFFAMPSG
ncbi:MAG TPA: hypothetical protein VH092_04685, partial [Urbifossiella sp.]|nr:hypothetical protein [Urbifossiella sp.]